MWLLDSRRPIKNHSSCANCWQNLGPRKVDTKGAHREDWRIQVRWDLKPHYLKTHLRSFKTSLTGRKYNRVSSLSKERL